MRRLGNERRKPEYCYKFDAIAARERMKNLRESRKQTKNFSERLLTRENMRILRERIREKGRHSKKEDMNIIMESRQQSRIFRGKK